jgi:hypothetical protein
MIMRGNVTELWNQQLHLVGLALTWERSRAECLVTDSRSTSEGRPALRRGQVTHGRCKPARPHWLYIYIYIYIYMRVLYKYDNPAN